MERQCYITLNELAEAESNGIVVFGGRSDVNLPLGEIRQAFAIEPKMYNRSFYDLSVNNALELFDEYVAPLKPETVLVHIGEADVEWFSSNPAEFDNKYCELIHHIKSQNKNCRISIVSLKNYENNLKIREVNTHLKYIADSEKCEYGDIASKRVWNPKNTMDAVSFVYSIGFVHPLKNKRPLYDLVKMVFCCEA